MQVINDGALRILIPEKGYKLANKFTGITAHKIYLCAIDDPDNYTEVVDEDYIPMEFKVELKEIESSMNETIDIILAAMDDMYSIFEPLLAIMPMTMSIEELEELIVTPMVKFYVLMIQRDLKTIDEVPEKFKLDVIKLMNN